MQSNLMRMRDPKVLAHNIERMKWSNKMDLIAMSTDKGKPPLLTVFSTTTFWFRVGFATLECIRIAAFELFSKYFVYKTLGEVIVQRLTLQTLWVHPAPYENARVCGFDWRPDVHILAVGKHFSGKSGK